MLIRPFDPERDRPACHRIWREVGWMKAGEEPNMDLVLDAGRALVAEINGEAECLVMAGSATLRHLESDLPLSAITGVTTSYVARRQGLAGRMLAQMVASEAEAGAAVSGLGMFDQGFYDKLGYGTSSYLHRVGFDPAGLELPVKARTPRRLTKDDWADIHANRLSGRRHHGACTLHSEKLTRADTAFCENGVGLGFRDDAGKLTHHVWLHITDVERGPNDVAWLAYRDPEDLMELLAVIKSLGDQVRLVRMEDPPGIVLQDLLTQPFKQTAVTDMGKFAVGVRSRAPFQFRICDVSACMERTHLPAGETRFNLILSDPIAAYLPEGTTWRGVGGEYRVSLGAESGADEGHDPSLPTLTASVGSFTRLWLGARSAISLKVTDGIQAPDELLRTLDVLFRLPAPHPDWEF